MKRQEGGGRGGLSEEPKIILPLFHHSIIKSDEKREKMVTRGEH